MAALARVELKERYESYGFVSPLHALGAAEVGEAVKCFERFATHRRQLSDEYSAHEMNHAWLPWLRDLGRHAAIVSAVGEAFHTRNVCLYSTELWAMAPNQPSLVRTWDWCTDGPSYTALLKPVDRRHFATACLALTACDARRGCLRVRPTAVGGKAMQEELQLELRPGEFSLHGPSTKYALCPNRSTDAFYCVVLRYVRASTTDLHSKLFGKDLVLLVAGKDEQRNFDELPELPGEATPEGKELRQAILERRWRKAVAGESLKGREGLKRPLLQPSSYTVVRTLEYGTTSSIHLAKLVPSQKGAVVKRVRDQGSQRAIERHFQEAKVLEKLIHPCIVLLVGVVDALDPLDMLLEFCPDGCLTSYMQQQSGKHAAQLLCDLICALAYMHREGFAHLDVKPDNLLVSNGRGKLCDFGTVMQMKRACKTDLTIVGTPGYRAPEIDGGEPSDPTKADVWSLGKVGEFVNQYSKGCWALLECATARDPDQRIPVQGCLEVYRELHGRGLIVT